MTYRAYAEYQQPSCHSSHEVPSDWEFRRLKFSATYNDESLPETTDPDFEIAYVDISSVNLVNGITAIDEVTFEEAPSRARRIVQDGDTIISTVRTYLKAIAPIEDPPENMIVSTGFAVIRPLESVNQRFLGYVLQNARFVGEVVANSTGVSYPAINPSKLVCIPFSYPEDIAEQQKIADFLDWKTGQIDGLISKKKQLIEKLKEKRIALITQAVTKGLNPDAPMRDSGTPWLGEVPVHWKVMKYGYRTKVQEGQVDPENEPYSEMPLIAPNHIEANTGRVFGLSTAREQAAISGKYLVRNGDVVYSKIRPHLNKCAIADFDGLCSADMYPIRTEPGVNSIFLFYWMLAQPFLDYATLCSMRVAMPKLNRETLNDAPLVVPPLNEQAGIIKYLAALLEKIDSLREKVDEAIIRLTEYRTSLITTATTGKIDVRKIKIGGAV